MITVHNILLVIFCLFVLFHSLNPFYHFQFRVVIRLSKELFKVIIHPYSFDKVAYLAHDNKYGLNTHEFYPFGETSVFI